MYNINNIVIPMSGAKVEKLQYKDVLTPRYGPKVPLKELHRILKYQVLYSRADKFTFNIGIVLKSKKKTSYPLIGSPAAHQYRLHPSFSTLEPDKSSCLSKHDTGLKDQTSSLMTIFHLICVLLDICRTQQLR